MSDDLVKRLRSACNGHPFAKIEWPHRVLHEAADEIERLQSELNVAVAGNPNLPTSKQSLPANGGWAPGNYGFYCIDCELVATGSKHSIRCSSCAED
jgi:hypothetical protein